MIDDLMPTVVDDTYQRAETSAAFSSLEAEINRAARTDGHVLVTGDAYAGRRVAARLIHQQSGRATARMAILRCAGLPDLLIESELFGHLRGSFTGAYRDKPGLLDLAAGGTLFLDDVGETSARVQSALLRFLETGDVTSVGADGPHGRVDVRIVAGDNQDLRDRIAAGAFSERLFEQLNAMPLVLRPLRDRPQDVPFLVGALLDARPGAQHPLNRRLSPAAMRQLAAYEWPGSVREMEDVFDRLDLRVAGRMVESADLPAEITG